MQLAPSAFLASAAACSDLVHRIVPSHLQGIPLPYLPDAMTQWSDGYDDLSPPEDTAPQSQRVWDTLKVSVTAERLLENAPDVRARARLLAASSRESGTWLQGLPVSSLSLRMDDNTIRVAVVLRLGSPLCRPHIGAEVDHLATHGLSCRWSEGRHFRHASLNDIVHCALSLQPRFPLAWSQQASIGVMGRDQMASHWSPGR